MKWTDEMNAYFKEIVPGHHECEIRQMFFEKFGIELTRYSIKNRKTKLGVLSGTVGGQFVKGQAAWNKGTKQSDWMSPEAIERTKATRFKANQVPLNTRPIGSTYTDHDGYTYVKVSDDKPNRFGVNGNWIPRSHIVWEQHTGHKVEPGEIVAHFNGICSDDDFENLVLLKRSEWAPFNREHFDYCDRETFELCQEITEIKKKIRKMAKEVE